MTIKEKDLLKETLSTYLNSINILIGLLISWLILIVAISTGLGIKTIWGYFISIVFGLFVFIIVLAIIIFLNYRRKIKEKIQKRNETKRICDMCIEVMDD